MTLDTFTPVSTAYPLSRSGGVAPVVINRTEDGNEERRKKWSRGPINITLSLKERKSLVKTDMDFIISKSGHTAFKFKDPYDYTVTGETVGSGTGSQKIFYLNKKYIDGSTIDMYLDDVEADDYSLDDEAGVVTFDTAPSGNVSVTADYEFYLKMYFDIKNPEEIQMDNIVGSYYMTTVRMVENLN